MSAQDIQSIVIAGGGTAGWMAAAALGHVLDAKRLDITLVESETIGTVGVGEATIPPIQLFNNMLGISEPEFLRETKATIKTGIEFVNWRRLGHSYFHPFGDFGREIEALPLHHHWLRAKASGYPHPLSDFALMGRAADMGRFTQSDPNPRSVFSGIHYAYQFDATLYAQFLRRFAENTGVRRIEGRIVDVEQETESGQIQSVSLDDGRSLMGDLFIDCTGFRGLLIEQALKAGYEDWSHFLPVDRAVAIPCESSGDPVPYTQATAEEAGWRWRIPLQHRVGNGYVYCSEFLDTDDAERTLRDGLTGAPIADAKHLRFTTGHRKSFWKKNVVALGLSAGFMEPLESTSIHLIQQGIARLLTLFPDRRFLQSDIDEYNRRTFFEYERIRDFLILHYIATERDDTAFWRKAKALPQPDTLRAKIDMYESAGRIHRDGNELFTVASWLAVMHGQGIVASHWDPVANRFNQQDMVKRLDRMRDLIERAAQSMPTHSEYLERVLGDL